MAKKPATGKKPDAGREQALELAAVKRWMARIKTVLDNNEDQYKKFTKMRNYVSGKALSGYSVKTNLIKSTMATLVPHIYARDPEVNIRPAEAVEPQRYEVFKKLARTAEIVVQHEFLDGHLKPQAKRMVRSQLTTGIGWLKVGVQTALGPDPIVAHDIEDARQQMAHIEALIEDADDDADIGEQEAAKAALVDNIQALEANLEVMLATGVTYDIAKSEDIMVLGDLAELVDYRWAPAIAQRIWYTKEKAEEEFGLTDDEIGKATTFSRRFVEDSDSDGRKTEDDEKKVYVCAWEIWSKEDQTIYTAIDGIEKWVRAPYTPDPVGRRFYPFFLYATNFIDGEFWPGIDVEDWIDLQEEFCDARSKFRTHRKRAMPARVGDAAAFDEGDAAAKKLSDPENNELVLIENPQPGKPIGDTVGILQYPPIDEKLYDTSPIRQDLMLVSGIQDADRGAVFSPKTATEAQIQESGNVNRLSGRTDDLDDMLQEVARYTLEICLQIFEEADVQRIAGPDAVWPKLSRDEIYSLLDVDIKAGSTGKPNKLAEQQAWAVLLPETQQMVLQIAQYRANAIKAMIGGDQITATMMGEIADGLEALLRETFRRADERLDPDEFIPQMPMPEAPAQPQPGVDNGQAAGQPAGQPETVLGGNGVTVVPAGPQRGVEPGDQNTGNLGAP
ncbi:MAG TPA: hypothetical protein VNE18_10400 [Rhodanobacter sp.]|nr:hypothetical protein [Rhodanobacter sp.]